MQLSLNGWYASAQGPQAQADTRAVRGSNAPGLKRKAGASAFASTGAG
jgi:hypothetical protein